MSPSNGSKSQLLGSDPVWTDCLFIFLTISLIYGATINKFDLRSYSLQQAVIESIIERGTYAVGKSDLELLRNVGDTFDHQGRLLPAKQPGQFTLGALAYSICCRWWGLTYVDDFFQAAAVVTWLSASLISAAAVACVYLIVHQAWGFSRAGGQLTAMAYALGTIVFPYSGVAHHDVIGASFLVGGFCAVEGSLLQGKWHGRLSLIGGLLLGLTLFMSMLPAVLVLGIAGYVVASGSRSAILGSSVGLMIGLAPLAIYNTHYFSNPLLQANIAGNFSDTFVSLDGPRFWHHARAYLGTGDISLLKYMPIVVLATAGIFGLPGRLRSQRIALGALIVLHLAFVLNIPTIGHCQYGPRYLIPLVPFAMLGLPGTLEWAAKSKAALPLLIGVAGVGAYSLTVNLVGALQGTMYCDIHDFAFVRYLDRLPDLQFDLYPLSTGCLIGLSTLLLVRFWPRRTRHKI